GLPPRRRRGARAARRLARHPGGRVRGDRRGVGLRQVDVDEPDRLRRPADARHLPPGRRRRLHALRQRARRDPQPPDRLRLPELQPARAVDGARERGASHDLRQRALARAAPARARAARRRLHRAHRHLPRRADRVGRAAGTVPACHGGRSRMNLLWMTVVTAHRALRRNVLRSALTMLGVIIGVAAVLTMVSIGRGANAAVQREIQSLGNNLVMIIPGATTANGVHSGSGSAASLTVADATAITKECPAVTDVAWAKRQVVQVVYGNQNWATAAQGVAPSYLSVRDWRVGAGRFFDQQEDAGAKPVAVLGQTVVDQLFAAGEDPIGAIIRLKNVPFEVIGVLARKGQTAWGQDQDDVVLIPFLTAERRVLGTQILGTVDMV